MMENGTNVVVAVRPNDFVMTPDPKGNNVVIRKEFRGDDTLFWVKTRSGETIRCKHKIHTTLFVGLRGTLAPEKYVKFNAFLK